MNDKQIYKLCSSKEGCLKYLKENRDGFFYKWSYLDSKKAPISEDEFRIQYSLQPFRIGKTFRNTKREDRKQRCGECSFFGDKGCTTSYLEAKYGSKNTPACSEFIPRILGTKSTFTILDDDIIKRD